MITLPRQIDYDKEIAYFLWAVYGTEYQFRFENHENGFIFSFLSGVWTRTLIDDLYDGKHPICESEDNLLERVLASQIDWYERYACKTLATICEQVTIFFLEHPDEINKEFYLRWLQKSKPFNKALTKKQIRFAEFFRNLVNANVFFRIESQWDVGFKFSIIDKAISPSRIEIDEMNCLAIENLNCDTNCSESELIAIPEKDWIEKFGIEHIEEAGDKLIAII